ncbi:transcription termination/antitermination protein NusG [Rothia sp. P6271]|uniref:transcription termination/antitermination protein NusG n=1 Tax=Rothia sp. P6271 TaxID=3402659 RepID=UPI003AD0A29F
MSEQELAHEAQEAVEVSEQATADDAQVEVEDALDVNTSEETLEISEENSSEEESAVDSEPAVDPLEAFKSQLRRQEGDWFVVHTYAGFENKVKGNLESRAQTLNMEEYIFEVQVPMEEVKEYKNTVEKIVRRVRIPGYVLVRMELTDESWGLVRHTPGVTGFVGSDAYNPVPLRLNEVIDMLAPVFVEEQAKAGNIEPPQPQIEVDYEVGETVNVKDGPFVGYPATISEIKPESSSLVLLISVFERETPVTVSFSQVEKV